MNDANEAQSALYAALASAIGETEGVAKHGSGQGYMYAKAEAVMREADRVLTKHGISVAPIGATLTVAGVAESPKGARTIFTLTCQFLVAHRAGGSFIGEMTIAVGTNLNATPPQATSSAYTCCERDFYRALLRMPRSDKDDVEHESHRRVEREEREPEPARPTVAPPAARKATRVLAGIGAVKSVAEWDKVREGWDANVLAHRTPDDDLGYTAAECEAVKAALAAAAARVGA